MTRPPEGLLAEVNVNETPEALIAHASPSKHLPEKSFNRSLTSFHSDE